MNLENALLSPEQLYLEEMEKIAYALTKHQRDFDHLLQLIASDNRVLSKRAAWCFSLAADIKPSWIYSRQARLVNILLMPGVPEGAVRNVLRVLRNCSLNKDIWEPLTFYCFKCVEDPDEPIAIRAFCIHILGKLALEIPDLIPEVKAIIGFHFTIATPGLVSAGKSVLDMLKKKEARGRAKAD